MGKLFVIFISLVSFCGSVFAGYDKTEWGMSIAKVKKLYPGGVLKKEQGGRFNYSIVRVVGTISNAYTAFSFSSDKKLDSVFILIPKTGTDVDLNSGHIEFGDIDQYKNNFKFLSDLMKEKYGEPSSVSKENMLVWDTKDADFISLSLLNVNTKEPVHVGLYYKKLVPTKDLTKGL